jgi:hypothetical protein
MRLSYSRYKGMNTCRIIFDFCIAKNYSASNYDIEIHSPFILVVVFHL